MKLSTRRTSRYGWLKDRPDYRDFHSDTLGIPAQRIGKPLPAVFSLRAAAGYPACYDQGQLGSCTANGEAFQFGWAMIHAARLGSKTVPFVPSRLWIYYEERFIEGTVDYDSGAQPRDGFVAMTKLGVPPETDWPYDVATFRGPPPAAARKDAPTERVLAYVRRRATLGSIKSSVLHDAPVGLGFTVYESFESAQVAQTGVVPMPFAYEEVVGGHYTVIVGWNDHSQTFEVRNSWSPAWGDHGHFHMPYAYVLDRSLAGDNWALVKIS